MTVTYRMRPELVHYRFERLFVLLHQGVELFVFVCFSIMRTQVERSGYICMSD